MVRALQHFRRYLIGLKFVIVTDLCLSDDPLKSAERVKDLLPRIACWWIYLQDFDFTLKYRMGVLRPHADYRSKS